MNEQNIHRLDISPDWQVRWARGRSKIKYSFESSDSCPGYHFTILAWRLRRQNVPVPDHQTLAALAFHKLRDALGAEAFPETNSVKAESDKASGNQLMNSRPVSLEPQVLTKYQFDLATDTIRDILSPRVVDVAIPLLTLMGRDRVEYAIDRVPWPFASAPRALLHLATSGFGSKFTSGIIALPPHGDDVWVVSDFEMGQVGSTGDRAARQRDFPFLADAERLAKAADAVSAIPAVIAENERRIRDQQERLALLSQAITSSVRTAHELAEQKLVRRSNDLCLSKLSDEELLLFLLLTGYRWKKEQKKKIFSKRTICWVLGLGTNPHPEIVSRKESELKSKYPSIGPLIASFRTQNLKGERRDKHREISFDGMTDSERRKLGLDDANQGDDDV